MNRTGGIDSNRDAIAVSALGPIKYIKGSIALRRDNAGIACNTHIAMIITCNTPTLRSVRSS